MIVFKNYLRIVKTMLPVILLITSIFIVFVIVFNSVGSSSTDFLSSKPKIAIVNEDDSLITSAFIEYVEKNSEIVKIENNEASHKDALFHRAADYIMILPKGFGISMQNDNPLQIETMKVPDSTVSFYTEMLLERFLNMARVYVNVGMSDKEISDNLRKTFETNQEVIMAASKSSELSKVATYYNFTNYTMLAVCVMVIGMVMREFNRREIKRRNTVSKTNYRIVNLGITCGNAVLVFALFLIYAIIAFVLYPNAMTSTNGIYFLLNSLLFSLVSLSIGTLVGTLVSNREAQSAIVNVLALGSSFLCGAFVPQEFLGSAVLTFGHIFPSFYFIDNNNKIAELVNFTRESLNPIFINGFIILIFTIGLILLTNFVTRLKRKEN